MKSVQNIAKWSEISAGLDNIAGLKVTSVIVCKPMPLCPLCPNLPGANPKISRKNLGNSGFASIFDGTSATRIWERGKRISTLKTTDFDVQS